MRAPDEKEQRGLLEEMKKWEEVMTEFPGNCLISIFLSNPFHAEYVI